MESERQCRSDFYHFQQRRNDNNDEDMFSEAGNQWRGWRWGGQRSDWDDSEEDGPWQRWTGFLSRFWGHSQKWASDDGGLWSLPTQ